MTKPAPALDPNCVDEAPHADALTPYDTEHLIAYIHLLDTVADGADWAEVARIVLPMDPSRTHSRSPRVGNAPRAPNG